MKFRFLFAFRKYIMYISVHFDIVCKNYIIRIKILIGNKITFIIRDISGIYGNVLKMIKKRFIFFIIESVMVV